MIVETTIERSSLLYSGILCLVLIASHYLLPVVSKPLEKSFAIKHIISGILFALLFIHIIPELAEHTETIH